MTPPLSLSLSRTELNMYSNNVTICEIDTFGFRKGGRKAARQSWYLTIEAMFREMIYSYINLVRGTCILTSLLGI